MTSLLVGCPTPPSTYFFQGRLGAAGSGQRVRTLPGRLETHASGVTWRSSFTGGHHERTTVLPHPLRHLLRSLQICKQMKSVMGLNGIFAKHRCLKTRQQLKRQVRRQDGVRWRGYKPYRTHMGDLQYLVKQPPFRGGKQDG